MRIQADEEGKKAIRALTDAALRHNGDDAFNLVAVVKQELQKPYPAPPLPPVPSPPVDPPKETP